MLRFAASPTGDMSLSNLRVALFNLILSKQRAEELLIRIDDTDNKKNIEGKEKEIQEILALFSIEHSRVVAQSENIKYHTGMGMKLLLDKKAFNCFCSDEALNEDRKQAIKEGKPYSYSGFCTTISDETKFQCNAPFVVRLQKPEQNIKFVDILKGELEYTPDEVDSFVILDHDKRPTAIFASGVDDMLYDTSLVIREDEFLNNTPKEIHLRDALGYSKDLEYIHIPNIVNKNKKDTPSVNSLIDNGYLPAAIANYLVLLDYETPKEIFSIEEAVEWFDISKISKDKAKFDIEKLNEINKEHLKTIDELRLSKLLGYADEDLGKLAKIYLEELNTLNKIKTKLDTIFGERKSCKGYNNEYIKLKEVLKELPFIDSYEKFEKTAIEKSGLSGDKFLVPFRFILTGELEGPKLDKIYPLIKNYLGEII